MTGRPHQAWLDSALDGARAYLLGRQCANGGFSFYRMDYLEEPDPSDTWHAVAALGRLGATVPRQPEIVRYATSQPVSEQPYGLYFRTRVFDLLGLADPEATTVVETIAALPIEHDGLKGTHDLCERLQRLRLTLWLKRRFDQTFAMSATAKSLLALEADGGGFGAPPNLIDTRMALSCLALCETPQPARCASFIARLAIPDFGFRLTEHSLSPTLDAVCAGLACCRRLGLAIAHADAALLSILDCQTGNGGFARAPGALPDIRLTHLALIGLEVLAGPLSRPTGELP